MTRCDTVSRILKTVHNNEIVVASTGYIAREVYNQNDRPLNFYMMGSMGNALAIGIGLAMNVEQRVTVINGDGSCLMSMGTLYLFESLKLDNLRHLLLYNGCHESTGGQRICVYDWEMGCIGDRTQVLNVETSKDIPGRIPLSPKEITDRFKNALRLTCNK